MRRIASLILVAVLVAIPLAALAMPPVAYAQEPALEAPADLGPDTRTEDERIAEQTQAIQDEAWTFRVLVPIAMVVSAIAVLATIGVYTFRVKARYRVAK